ncbi:MAG: dolichol-P-glucose synthetase [Chitinophagales bacterium]|nr:MAG: dolichol-P-glucose synthetase [Chitinophagales bacterium]
MKKNLFSAVKVIFFLGIGLLLIWLVVKDLNAEQRSQILQAFREANYWWLIPSAIVAFASHYSRAVRWNMMLRPMGYNPSATNSFLAVMIGYLANLAVPRLGEITRCGILNRYEKVPIYKSVGTVVTERAIDLIILFLLFLFVFLAEFNRLGDYASREILVPLRGKLLSTAAQGPKLLLAAALVLVTLSVLYLVRKKLKNLSIIKRIFGMILGFAEGLKAIKNVERPFIFLFHSLFIWAGYLFMLYFCFFCLPETSSLGLGAAVSLLAFGSLAMIATPGGIGTYPIIMQMILMRYLLPADPATNSAADAELLRLKAYAFGWIAWSGQTLMIIIVGLISLLILPLINRQKDGQD